MLTRETLHMMVRLKKIFLAMTLIAGLAVISNGLAGGSASAATDPSTLEPLPLRTLHTKVGEKYLYTSSWDEAKSADENFGLTPSSKRGMGFVFKYASLDTKPLYRLKKKSNGNWLMTSSETEKNSLLSGGSFVLEGITGHVYKTTQPGAELVYRYYNGKGWRLAFASRDAEMKAAGYSRSGGSMGYFLKKYYQVGAYYFGNLNEEGSTYIQLGTKFVYGRDNDWWGGVKDFYGQEPGVPQDTRGWEGDFSHLKPAIGYYDNSDPAVLAQHIDQATSRGINYFSFYWYWNNETKDPQIDGGLNAFLQASNKSDMKFTISPCFHPSSVENLNLEKPDFQTAANYIADAVAQPNFLTTQSGRPLMFMCDTRGIDSANVASANEFVTLLKQTVQARAGKNLFIMNHSEAGVDFVNQLNGDGLTCLNHGKSIQNGDYDIYLNELKSYFTTFDGVKPTLRCGTAAFDERPRTDIAMPKDQARYYRDHTKAKFSTAMQLTKESMDSAPASEFDNYLNMYAWNEWHEGGIIEPNVRDGDYYLSELQRIYESHSR